MEAFEFFFRLLEGQLQPSLCFLENAQTVPDSSTVVTIEGHDIRVWFDSDSGVDNKMIWRNHLPHLRSLPQENENC